MATPKANPVVKGPKGASSAFKSSRVPGKIFLTDSQKEKILGSRVGSKQKPRGS